MLIFSETKVAKKQFYGAKKPINIWDVNLHNIVISKLVETKTDYKYLIRYLDKVIRSLVLVLPKISKSVSTFKVKDGDKNKNNKLPYGHIFVDSPSVRRLTSTWKVRRDLIDFEKRIHVEIMTSIRCGNFNVDPTLKIDEISMIFPRGFFYVVSMSNRRNCFTRCFLSVIFKHFLLWEPILS